MPRIKFDQLVEIYAHTAFSPTGDSGLLDVASAQILETLKSIDADEDAAIDSGISVDLDPIQISLGDKVEIKIQPPKIALGVLAADFDALIKAPGAQIKEPAEYYVVSGGYTKGGKSPPAELSHYRNVLRFVATLADAASYLDPVRQELVFLHSGKFSVPVIFTAKEAREASSQDIERLVSYFSDDLHGDQKLEILSSAVVSLAAGVHRDSRFGFLLRNASILADHVRDGYTLFVSSFSYAKVRGEIEAAKIEHTSKVHKTIVDIQGQLLGVPIAAFVVASQMKTAVGCGSQVWINSAVLVGAWIFVLMLLLAVVNQWATLSTIHNEVERQEKKIKKDYDKVASSFGEIFKPIRDRICWHRVALVLVALVGIGSAIFATFIYFKITNVDVFGCLSGRVEMVFPST